MPSFNLFRRGREWKSFVEASLRNVFDRLDSDKLKIEVGEKRIAELEISLEVARQKIAKLDASQYVLDEYLSDQFEELVVKKHVELSDDYAVYVALRDNEVVVLLDEVQPARRYRSANLIDLIRFLKTRQVRPVVLRRDVGGTLTRVEAATFLSDIADNMMPALSWLNKRVPDPVDQPAGDIADIIQEKGCIDFAFDAERRKNVIKYYGDYVFAEPKRRSVLFTRPCYYNFYYLAKALRARGWDAVSLSTEQQFGENAWLYHGHDEVIHDPDPEKHRALLGAFLKNNADRFGIIHHYGLGVFSLFPELYDTDSRFSAVPWDMVEAKRRGVLLGYSHSGCLDGVSQTQFRDWSPSTCANCVWNSRPDVCSDERNLAWGRKMTAMVDLFCTETDPTFDFKGHPTAFRGPLTFALDPETWKPDLSVPDKYDMPRSERTVRVYHGVGNYKTRTVDGRNVKGTGVIIDAIERLRAEGIDIELAFVESVPSQDNRYVQVQADIIVDQLNYGRYGALAREGMMLGKPVVGRVNKFEQDGAPATACIQETPIVHADESTVVDVLRDLALNPSKRSEIGRASREHAIKWWSADRLAERFERVYDHIREHGRPPAEEEVP